MTCGTDLRTLPRSRRRLNPTSGAGSRSARLRHEPGARYPAASGRAGSVSVRRGLVRRLSQLLDLTFERRDPLLERCEDLGDVLPARDQDPSPAAPVRCTGVPSGQSIPQGAAASHGMGLHHPEGPPPLRPPSTVAGATSIVDFAVDGIAAPGMAPAERPVTHLPIHPEGQPVPSPVGTTTVGLEARRWERSLAGNSWKPPCYS